MRTVYLILAHHQPAHLAKLVNSLNCNWATTFIHVDAKFDILQFQRLIHENKNICFLVGNQRIKVNWGGFSQVAAILNLLRAALSSGIEFDRYCLLSGADFPIKDISHIYTEFASQKEFIRIDRELGALSKHRQSKNIKRLYFRDYPQFGGNLISGISPRKLNKKTKFYHGSSWWALTDQSIRYIFNFLKENPDYIDFYRYTNSSDEIFFHSIIKRSPFSENITHDFEREASLDEFLGISEYGCHYICWKEGDRLPKLLDVNDIDSLMNSKALFARKFDKEVSKDLISILEQKILTGG